MITTCPTCPTCETEVRGSACACGWQIPKQAPEKPVARWLADGITKEQFGLDLYEAVVRYGRLGQLKKQRAHLQQDQTLPQWERERDLDRLHKEERHLVQELIELQSRLSPEDQRELLARYESAPVSTHG